MRPTSVRRPQNETSKTVRPAHDDATADSAALALAGSTQSVVLLKNEAAAAQAVAAAALLPLSLGAKVSRLSVGLELFALNNTNSLSLDKGGANRAASQCDDRHAVQLPW